VRRRISSTVDSWSMGAEYASRKNGVSLEEFDRDLTAMAPSHVLFEFLVLTRFLRRTGSPPRIKSGAGLRRKTPWSLSRRAIATSVS
jgi:hypothetical protein